MIQWVLAIWSLLPLPFLKPAWTSGSSRFMYCWSLAWRILILLLLLSLPYYSGCGRNSISACPSITSIAGVRVYAHQEAVVPSVLSNSLMPHGLHHTRLPCPSPSPGACSNSCPLSQWSHSTISSSVIPFSSCLQSFLASGSFLMSWLFASRSQSIQ